MDRMPLLALFLQAIPEGLILITLGLVLAGVRPRLVPVGVVAVGESVAMYFIRSLPIPFGVHTLCGLGIIAAGLRFLVPLTWRTAFLAAVLGGISVLAAESLGLPLVTALFGVSREALLANAWLRVTLPLPYEAALAVLAWVCWRHRWSVLARDEEGRGGP
ncbi:MAG: hypothetical protein ACPLRW_06345 [Moorellales bacterium]